MASEADVTLVIAIVGAVCGVTGAVLGIINTVSALQRNKVRLKVTPQHAIPVGALADSPLNFSMEIINLSDFPVTIADCGFRLTGGRHATLATVQGIEQPCRLPCRLEPHAAYTKWFEVRPDSTDWGAVECAYARTECGAEITGNSGALEQIVKKGVHHGA